MKKLGFTLIELLAVIIILAIVALIATPIILDVVEDARISAGRSEANMILGGINNYCATEEIKSQMDSNYSKICTSDMDSEDVKEMVNLGNATIDKIVYNGSKLTELEITSNNHKFTLCPSGTFAMDDEKCDGGEVGVITTGPIKDVVLSNFPYLATNGNGCVTPTPNNYSYMGGCYLKDDSLLRKEKFYSTMRDMGMDNDTITQTFFNSYGDFKSQEFELWYRNLLKQDGTTDEMIDQILQELEKNTFFDAIFNMTSEEYFLEKNNSLWYSGFLWLILGINADGSIRLITNENVTSIPWGASDTAQNWDGSHAKEWLNDYFYSRLKGNNIIKEQTWCSEITADENSARTECTTNLSKEKSKVGLITLDEYNLSGGRNSYLNMGQEQWTMTPYSISDALDVRDNGIAASDPVSYPRGLRAVINVNSDVTITGGNGTLGATWSSQSGPYILNEDKNAEISGKLNEKATSGEYVMFAGKKYRIVDKDSNGNTKLILDGYYEEDGNIFEMKYNDTSTNVFSTTTGIGKKLNDDVLNWITNNSDIEKGKLVSSYTWYQNEFDDGQSYKISLNEESPTRSIDTTVGLIRVGEMLSSQSSSMLSRGYTTTSNRHNADNYWTMTMALDNNIYAYTIYNDDNVLCGSDYLKNALRPVIVIKSDVNIISGNGTWSNPYQI